MRKRCLALAFLLALTAVFPARAETVMESELALPPLDETPVINVTVPSTGRIILNPYGMSVETSDGTSTEQIVSNTLPIINESSVPVVVSASAAGHISENSGMEFASSPPPSDAREKVAFLYVEFQNEDGAWQNSYTGEENQILVSAAASEEKDVLTLAAGPSEGVFRVFGATSVTPDDPWCSDDAVSVTLTFTFTAAEDAAGEPAEASAEESTEKSIEEPPEEPTEEPTEKPAEVPTEEPTEEPTEKPTEEPSKEPAGEPTEEPTEEPTKEPFGEPTEDSIDDPAKDSVESPTGELGGQPETGAGDPDVETPPNISAVEPSGESTESENAAQEDVTPGWEASVDANAQSGSS